MKSMPFPAYLWPILTYLERFNQIGAFTVDGDLDGLLFAVISKVTGQFLRKLGLSGI